jgi:tetratricopeptide (TPR) repeat protein
MIDPFLAIAESLALSRSELTVVDRYRNDPQGRAFLPMSDLLRTHQKRDEAIELLMRGLQLHPGFSAARVILARELYTKGILSDALEILLNSPVALDDNALAQKLFFRLYILAGDLTRVELVRHQLETRSMMDDETRELADRLGLQGFDGAQMHLIHEFRSRGVEPRLFSVDPASSGQMESSETEQEFNNIADDYAQVPLNQVFAGINEGDDQKLDLGGVAMDSTTLAEIYEKQRLFGKALEVYRRLLRINPGNDHLRQQLRRVAKQVHQQRKEDLEIDASIVDEMEQIEVIDRQMRFYTKILNKLS